MVNAIDQFSAKLLDSNGQVSRMSDLSHLPPSGLRSAQLKVPSTAFETKGYTRKSLSLERTGYRRRLGARVWCLYVCLLL